MNKFEIASAALSKMGHPPLTAFEGKSAAQIVAKASYEDILEQCLSKGWHFASIHLDMNLLEDAPLAPWTLAHQIPTSPKVLQINFVAAEDNVPVRYARMGDKILTSTSTSQLNLNYVWRPDEETFPPYFRKYFGYRLAALFALGVARKGKLATYFEGAAEDALTEGLLTESQSVTSATLGRKPGHLVSAARGRKGLA